MPKVWQQPLPEIYTQLSDAELRLRIESARETLGDRLVILGHHYQQDAVIDFADFTGDSERALHDADFGLWRGHCSGHGLFRPERVSHARAKYPNMRVMGHPACK